MRTPRALRLERRPRMSSSFLRWLRIRSKVSSLDRPLKTCLGSSVSWLPPRANLSSLDRPLKTSWGSSVSLLNNRLKVFRLDGPLKTSLGSSVSLLDPRSKVSSLDRPVKTSLGSSAIWLECRFKFSSLDRPLKTSLGIVVIWSLVRLKLFRDFAWCTTNPGSVTMKFSTLRCWILALAIWLESWFHALADGTLAKSLHRKQFTLSSSKFRARFRARLTKQMSEASSKAAVKALTPEKVSLKLCSGVNSINCINSSLCDATNWSNNICGMPGFQWPRMRRTFGNAVIWTTSQAVLASDWSNKAGSSFDSAHCDSLVTFMACSQASPFVSSISSRCAEKDFTGTLALCSRKCRIPVLSWSHALGIVHASCPTSFRHAKTLRTPWGGSSAGTCSLELRNQTFRPPKPFSVINLHSFASVFSEQLRRSWHVASADSNKCFSTETLRLSNVQLWYSAAQAAGLSTWKFMRTMCSAKGASRMDQI